MGLPANILSVLVDTTRCIELTGRRSDVRLDYAVPFVSRTYTLAVRITTNYPQVGQATVIEAARLLFGFDIGASYITGTGQIWEESDALAFCTAINAATENPNGDGCSWIVEATYAPIDPIEFDRFADPLTAPIEISYGYETREEIVDRDALSGVACVNSAWDPFDPPVTRERGYPIVQITRNEPAFNPLVADAYRDKVNAGVFLGRAARTVKCKDITAQSEWSPTVSTPDNYYFIVTYQFAINPKTWDKVLLDAGYNTWDYATEERSAIANSDGTLARVPVMLDGAGSVKLPNASGVIEPYFFPPFRVYEEADFSALGLGV